MIKLHNEKYNFKEKRKKNYHHTNFLFAILKINPRQRYKDYFILKDKSYKSFPKHSSPFSLQ